MREPYQPTLEEVLEVVASSLRLEGFDTTPARLAQLLTEDPTLTPDHLGAPARPSSPDPQ